MRDGNGLALVGDYHVGDGSVEAGPESADARTRNLCLRRARKAFAENAEELRTFAESANLGGEALVRSSRLAARVDNNAIADGFQLYLHTFIVATSGEWAIVQQGMNGTSALARRYHWHSAAVRDFTSEPHSGIVGEHQGTIMNLVNAQAKAAQDAVLEITRANPESTLRVTFES